MKENGKGLYLYYPISQHNQLSNSWTKTLNLVSKIRFFELSLLDYNENVAKQNTNTLNENGDKQIQNTHVEEKIFARQK